MAGSCIVGTGCAVNLGVLTVTFPNCPAAFCPSNCNSLKLVLIWIRPAMGFWWEVCVVGLEKVFAVTALDWVDWTKAVGDWATTVWPWSRFPRRSTIGYLIWTCCPSETRLTLMGRPTNWLGWAFWITISDAVWFLRTVHWFWLKTILFSRIEWLKLVLMGALCSGKLTILALVGWSLCM